MLCFELQLGTLFLDIFPFAVKPEVIDYGHGSKTDDPLADLDRVADQFERDRADRLDRPEWDDPRYPRGVSL